MSEKSRRIPKGNKAAPRKRRDQRSDPKTIQYKTHCKIPDPSLEKPNGKFEFNDEQLAMPFVVPKRIEAPPFLKWVGGKAGLLRQLEEFFPHEIDRYIEPFLGGGAVFFHLKHRFPDMRAFLRDGNKELINCYRVVRDRPEELMRLLDEHTRAFRAEGDDYFYAIRKQHDLTDDLARAARTIFLNKTCFNGLWRVNAKGGFNTPVGSNKNPNLYSRENLLAASAALQDAQLEAQDFRKTVDEARRGDFIYFDPPYLPISAYSDFKRDTLEQFREADQVELARVFRELDAKGCRVVLSNSEHPRTRELYAGFPIHVVSAAQFINCMTNKPKSVNLSAMNQREAVVEAMKANGGYAMLGHLYKEALKIPGVEWGTKTPFKSINRIVQNERYFFRIRPGLWALLEAKDKLPPDISKKAKPESDHTYYQGLLVELGNLRKQQTFVPAQDRGRKFLGKPLGDVATVEKIYRFTYDEIVRRAATVDVVWFSERKFPAEFIEVENTTDIGSKFHKFLDFDVFTTKFRIVAPNARQEEFKSRLKQPVFKSIAGRTRFTSYETVADLHIKASAMAAMEAQWDELPS
jgi:DNA adenine methylase Dam